MLVKKRKPLLYKAYYNKADKKVAEDRESSAGSPDADAQALPAARIFEQLDKDGDKHITKNELRKAFDRGMVIAGGTKATVAMNSIEGGRRPVPITAAPGIDIQVVKGSKIFQDWLAGVDKDPKLFVDEIKVQSVDMFGPNIGFMKFPTKAITLQVQEPHVRLDFPARCVDLRPLGHHTP